jgi:bifunctional UDP-N-acetylglucosamine pyrophosphorylase / glucosamine-1-phosphate N-acetyltransferase
VTVRSFCVITESEVQAGSVVGPFAQLRDGAVIGERARIGNFVEVKKSAVGPHAKSLHLTYLGDAKLGAGVNVGAGVVTCNYDGERKHTTVVEDGVFVGSGSMLVAPIRIGKGSYVAAGSTLTEDVPPESLALGRARQVNKEGWVRERKNKGGEAD